MINSREARLLALQRRGLVPFSENRLLWVARVEAARAKAAKEQAEFERRVQDDLKAREKAKEIMAGISSRQNQRRQTRHG